MMSSFPPMLQQEILSGLFVCEIEALIEEHRSPLIEHAIIQQEKVEKQILENKYTYLFEQLDTIPHKNHIRFPDAIRMYQESKLYYLDKMTYYMTHSMMRDIFVEKWMKQYPETEKQVLMMDLELSDIAMDKLSRKPYLETHITKILYMNKKIIPLSPQFAFLKKEFDSILAASTNSLAS